MVLDDWVSEKEEKRSAGGLRCYLDLHVVNINCIAKGDNCRDEFD